MDSFNEDHYYSAYKSIRNRFRKYNYIDVINGCLQYINAPADSKIKKIERHPWLVLLLIKWIIIDGGINQKGAKKLDNKKLMDLLQMVHVLANKARLPNQFEHYRLFMRAISYQQFIYQWDFSISHLSRQSLLFADLPENHIIQAKFKELTGLSISTFLELSLVTLCRFLSKNNWSLPISWYRNVQSKYSEEEVRNFLKTLSVPALELEDRLKSKDGGSRRSSEYYEQTPFMEFPLIMRDNEFVCVYPNILYRSIEHFIYDRLRQWDSSKFMDKFGKIFEKYVDNSLAYSQSIYVTESDIKNKLGRSGSQIDFIVSDGMANVFIDAKGVEIANLGKVSHISDVVKDKVENSIIKAIEQAHDVLNKLSQANLENWEITPRDNNYLIVVTFKELYLGNGVNFYESIARDKIDEIYAKYDRQLKIALEDMYFITIEEFDLFCELVNKGKIGMSDGIERAREADRRANTAKFDFMLHLASWDSEIKIPAFLSTRSDQMFRKIKQAILAGNS